MESTDRREKDAEMERQRQLAEREAKPERLKDEDKTIADSFPASDPPQPP
jgi:hypothetical protein